LGEINELGNVYYLNVKLLAVETSEILGSSSAQAEDPSHFLEMVNKAVIQLF